ncbi:hypothetical protein SERLA73DRAFT_187870 [Serpula lacrymans var. lacrymans S7.3]|uniref:Uncharacterized protein n=2 Tax=Serpula lacrymans var. lacrymans TaxID=341189 RepID=F8QAL9_SERL3|nr:uncharacterized protein SERLADRAFT_477746 [Serpula lacrymans var. lacrymans S7.9]EGN94809.1 hypothetical protein SERLA73DRAFT_187870 [Serpula lacrymans var. lacrymans S7.3]EGO20308.1 hypothetical protein SERLADRAFT_477746 [Serpula lacrymans var. lacrymans S7.9]
MRFTIVLAILASLGFAAAASTTETECPACPKTLKIDNVTYNLVLGGEKATPEEPISCFYAAENDSGSQTYCSYKPNGTILEDGDGYCPKKVPVSADNCV